jgi:hypothetical protein
MEINEVKEIRAERNSLPVASPVRQPELDGTPITALGLKPETLEVCKAQPVFFFKGAPAEDKYRVARVERGIDTIEILSQIPRDELIEFGFSQEAIRDIEKQLRKHGYTLKDTYDADGEPSASIGIPLRLDDLAVGFEIDDYRAIQPTGPAIAVLKEDIALVPGMSAETVAWLKRIPIHDSITDRVRHVQTVSDLVQLQLKLPRDWVGFDGIQVNNFLLSFNLQMGMTIDDATSQAFHIPAVHPVGYTDEDDRIVLESLMSAGR